MLKLGQTWQLLWIALIHAWSLIPTNVPMETGQAQTEFNDAVDDAEL